MEEKLVNESMNLSLYGSRRILLSDLTTLTNTSMFFKIRSKLFKEKNHSYHGSAQGMHRKNTTNIKQQMN